jgi:hypothetical protein
MLHYPNTASYKQACSNKKQEERSTRRKHRIVKDRQWIDNGSSSVECYSLVLSGEVIR